MSAVRDLADINKSLLASCWLIILDQIGYKQSEVSGHRSLLMLIALFLFY